MTVRARTCTPQATRLPLESLAALVFWAAPQLDAGSVQIGGTARDVVVDWDAARAPGARLYAQARLEEIALAPASHAFAVSGLAPGCRAMSAPGASTLAGGDAHFELPRARAALSNLRVASHLAVALSGAGWRVASDALNVEHGATRLRVSGSVGRARADPAPRVELRGSLERC